MYHRAVYLCRITFPTITRGNNQDFFMTTEKNSKITENSRKLVKNVSLVIFTYETTPKAAIVKYDMYSYLS